MALSAKWHDIYKANGLIFFRCRNECQAQVNALSPTLQLLSLLSTYYWDLGARFEVKKIWLVIEKYEDKVRKVVFRVGV